MTVFELKEYRDGGVWRVDEIEDMVPFELDLMIDMIKQRVQERKELANAQ